jgi:hypothetical protein
MLEGLARRALPLPHELHLPNRISVINAYYRIIAVIYLTHDTITFHKRTP